MRVQTTARPVQCSCVIRPKDVVDARFEIESVAGSGGMGTVYRALDLQTNEHVALKVMTSGRDAARFVREAELLSTLAHPSIVKHVAHGTDADRIYIAMEWLEGEDLSARLAGDPIDAHASVTLVLRAA